MLRFDRIRKIVLGLVLIAVSGFIAFYVKDRIDRSNPVYAIPRITVSADLQDVPSSIGGYSWEFAFGDKVHSVPGSIYDLVLEEMHLHGGERLDIGFSVEPISYSIKRSDAYSYQFMQVYAGDNFVPYESGGYTYEIFAEFEQGTVLYYFYIVV